MNNPYFDAPLVLVDLETTGATPATDRITEVGLVQIDADGIRSWQSLVNPQRSIPPFIQQLTGINDAMVADAPTFAELAPTLSQKLEGRVFVAHNARFDYGFLKQEFKRLGLRFNARVLCTVKLSRKLYPHEHKHSLDTLVARHGLSVPGERHRALTDALLLQQFLDAAQRDHPVTAIHAAIQDLTRQPVVPPGVDPAIVDDLPENHGVYVFYGDGDEPLFIGRSSNVRKRVLTHFSVDLKDRKKAREAQMLGLLKRVDWAETSGEFGSLLHEASLLRTLSPQYSPRLRKTRELVAWRLMPQPDAPLEIALVPLENLAEAGPDEFWFGPFRSEREAKTALTRLADAHNLCRTLLGFETVAPCSSHLAQKCRGGCVGKEPVGLHNARVLAALSKLKMPAWPYAGPVALAEGQGDAAVLHVLENWNYLGSARDDEQLADLLSAPRPAFDLDMFKLIQAELKRGRLIIKKLT
ncbi:exonuclease domain-containing protein [Amantichitinum ursilacus]|uniref:DNA-directed DNA polymerase n=1 Tax=Amantichitinum ursilacus TaxID=857265 RepID=A0A0N0XKM5_9NEIS|nr:exonuclease domain-containing protein [Amantichitinum ursilacus]KPC53379.1 Excinuclease cho [Amantichitinum ursilacus]